MKTIFPTITLTWLKFSRENKITRHFFSLFQFAMQTILIKLCTFLGLLFLTIQTNAQITIKGKVHEKNGTPVQFANVVLEGTLNGTSTDTLGNFSISANATGKLTLVVSFVGYKTYRKELSGSKSIPPLDITLLPDQTALGEVIISAGSFEASDNAKSAKMDPIEVVTTAGSDGDVANAIRALPGAQQIGEQEGLFIRGGTGDETKQFIDGTLFRTPNYSSVPGILQPARVSPFLFKGITFSSGGYSALYGGALSGALILQSVDLPEKSSYLIGGSPVVGTTGFQRLSRNRKLSYGISSRYVNYSFYSKLIRQKPDYFHGPEYITADGNFRWKTSETGMLKLYIISTYNNIGLLRPDVDDPSLKSSFQTEGHNLYGNLSYRGLLQDKWKINLGLTYTFNDNNIYRKLLDSTGKQVLIPSYPYLYKNSTFKTNTNFANTKVVITRHLGKHSLRFGAEQLYEDDDYNLSDTVWTLTDNQTAGFAEADIIITKGVAARLGVRYERSSLLGISDVSPRLSCAYRFNNGGQINLAYGIFYQKPDFDVLLQHQPVPVNFKIFADQYENMGYNRADHYIINYTREADNRLFRIEAYYKRYEKLSKTVPSLSNNGSGYARGVELFYQDKKTIKGLNYWFTYTYLDTKRNYLNYPTSLRPDFSTPHTFSIVAKRFFEKINTSFNAAYYLATGRPYYDFIYNRETSATEIKDQGITKPYQTLNINISYMTTLFKNWKNKDFTVIAFNVSNVLGTKQVFGYDYSANGRNKVPVTLPAPRTFFIGIFMSFGVNYSQNFINENLK